MTRRKMTLVVVALVVVTAVVAVAAVRDRPVATPQSTEDPSSTSPSTDPSPVTRADAGNETTTDAPRANYESLAAARADGEQALGRTLAFAAWRGATAPDTFSAFPCNAGGPLVWARVDFDPEKRDSVRAIPPSLTSNCPRLHIRITENDDAVDYLEGELLTILDIEPEPPPEDLPEGVDFVSMDDLLLTGRSASGKVALLPFYRGHTEEGRFVAHPCEDTGGKQIVYVEYKKEHRQQVANLSTSPDGNCQKLRIRITGKKPQMNAWQSKLLSVD